MGQLKKYSGLNLDNQNIEVTIADGKIISSREVMPNSEAPYLFPPLCDIQHNGALGFAYNNLSDILAEEQLRKIADLLICHGVGRVLATFTTAPYEVLETGAKALSKALNDNNDLNTLFCGIFHEGVFISPKPGWRGGHDPAYIMPPNFTNLQKLNQLSGYRIKLVNVAPEISGAIDFISAVRNENIAVTLGHCNPTPEVTRAAVKAGAIAVTHFGNGASPLIHRFNNPFWEFLNNKNLCLGLVGDGFHLPPELIQAVYQIKSPDKCFVVSDANIYSGCKPGRYKRLGGSDCIIESNGFIHVPNEDILAGAYFQLDRAVETLVNHCNLTLSEAWQLASIVPATLFGIELPCLRPGDEATFVQARFEKKLLTIEKTIFQGKEYLPAELNNEFIV